MEHGIFNLADWVGTFAFAVSGALASVERRLDLFGILAIAYLTACCGGIIRDLFMGALPPVGLSDWRYLAISAVAAVMAIWARKLVARLAHPVAFFDSIGLAFFAVVGAQKALLTTRNIEAAVILGTITAVGGGLARDIVLNRVPVVLQKEIYAVAAIVAASLQVLAQRLKWEIPATPLFAAGIGFAIRMLAIRYGWSLPSADGTRLTSNRDQDAPPAGAHRYTRPR